MKLHLFFLIASIFFFINTECFSQNEQDKCTYKNGTISYVTNNGEVVKNIGKNLTVTYDGFFNKYNFRFTNSNGRTEKITFEGQGNGYVCSKDGLTYTHVSIRGIFCDPKYGPTVMRDLRFLHPFKNESYYIANYR